MVRRGGFQERSTVAGTAVLLVVVVVAGLRPVRLWIVEQLPVLAVLTGIQLPGPLPVLGFPLSEDPSWWLWGAQSLGALVIPVVFWLWMARGSGGAGRVAVRAWGATVVAVVAGCLVHLALASMLIPGGLVSFLLAVAGTVVVGGLVGVVLGVAVGVVCALVLGRTDGSEGAVHAESSVRVESPTSG